MTPVEIYDNVFVKRDDLCFPAPAPPFSKCRGVLEHLKKLKFQNITTIGYTETSVSMAGWGIVWACQQLNMKAVIFDPQYKVTPELLEYHRERWKEFGAEIIPIKAGMAKVNWNICRKLLKDKYNNSILLPLGLPLPETIHATAKETTVTLANLPLINTCVVNVGSGTIAAGIWKGMSEFGHYSTIYGIMGRQGNINMKLKSIEQKANLTNDSFFNVVKFSLIDPGWQYTQPSTIDCPFPSHPYYDLKAWEWLQNNKNNLKMPVLFWNIGRQSLNL